MNNDPEYTNSEVEHLIDEYVHSERDRKVLKARLITGLTYCEMSDIFNISERQLKRIVYSLKNKVFSHIY